MIQHLKNSKTECRPSLCCVVVVHMIIESGFFAVFCTVCSGYDVTFSNRSFIQLRHTYPDIDNYVNISCVCVCLLSLGVMYTLCISFFRYYIKSINYRSSLTLGPLSLALSCGVSYYIKAFI